MAAFTLQLRPDRGGDRCPVRLRISHDGTRRFLNVKVRVVAGKWRAGAQRVRSSHPDSARINSRLAEIESAAQEALVALQTSGRTVTAARLKSRVEQQLFGPDVSEQFCEYARQRIKAQYEHERTQQAKLASIAKFDSFLSAEEGGRLRIGEITERHVREFRRWLLEEEGNATSTAGKDLSAVRRVCKIAIKDGKLARGDDPFQDVSIDETTVSQKQPLPKDALERLKDAREQLPAYSPEAPKTERRLRVTADMWFWSYYMMGARYGDVIAAEWDEVQETGAGLRWRYTMQKTGAEKDLRVVPPAEAILEDYKHRSGRFVFPALDRYLTDPDYDLSTDEGVRRAQKARGSRVWKDLQILKERAAIEQKLSMHIARHTFAIRAIEAGWDIRELQTAFAHSTISTTEQYIASLRDDELDEQHADLF